MARRTYRREPKCVALGCLGFDTAVISVWEIQLASAGTDEAFSSFSLCPSAHEMCSPRAHEMCGAVVACLHVWCAIFHVG